jgi:TPR repeat protein
MVSAKEGFAPCQANVGYAYQHGMGVQQNLTEAIRWYVLAADQNNPEAQYNLFIIYSEDTIYRDDNLAIKYLLLSANNGFTRAQVKLANILDSNQRFEEAFEWYSKAAEAGDMDAQNNVGVCYKNGEGVSKNLEKAMFWFSKSAKQGCELAKRNIKAF